MRVIGIDQESTIELVRRACKPRQDQDTGILGPLSSNEFLGGQIHPVSQRRHEADPRHAVETREYRVSDGLDVADRRSVYLSEIAVRPSRLLRNLMLHPPALRCLGTGTACSGAFAAGLSQISVFEQLFQALSEDLDFECALIDGTIIRVHQHGTGAKGDLWSVDQTLAWRPDHQDRGPGGCARQSGALPASSGPAA